MSTLFRYLVKEVGVWIGMVLVALLALFAFFDFIHELSQLGVGSYTLAKIVLVVALDTPGRAYELLPIATLIGTLAALARFVASSEFTVMQVSGLSAQRMAAWLASLGLVLTVVTFVFGEYVAPPTGRVSAQIRLSATRAVVAREFRSGLWVRDGTSFINVREMLPDSTLVNLRIYDFDKAFGLRMVSLAGLGAYLGPNRWQLRDVTETHFEAGRVTLVRHPTLEWKSVLTPEILSVVMVVPEQMSVETLYRYIRHLSANRQKTTRYEIAFWSKVSYPFAIPVMMFLALPFAFHNTRVTGIGGKVFTGIMLGMGFHLANRLFGHLGLLNDWNPLLSAVAPTLSFLAAAGVMMWRAERV